VLRGFLGNEGGGKNFKASSEFDSQHYFVALLNLKWELTDRILFWGGAVGDRVLPEIVG
jgi:hypothetical protein